MPICSACTLHSECIHPCITYDGPENAQVLFLGEAPGAEEDRQGKPFIGPSGSLLRDLASEVSEGILYGFDNVVRCRPGNNRSPLQEEIDACSYITTSTIESLPLKAIICVGGISAKFMKGIKVEDPYSILSGRGEIFHRNRILVMPIIHPSFILRNLDQPIYLYWLREDVERTFASVSGKLHIQTFKCLENPETIIVEDGDAESALYRAIAESSAVTYDFETIGTKLHRNSFKVVSLGICTNADMSKAYVIPGHRADVVRRAVQLWHSKTVYAHNMKFDENVLRRMGVAIPDDVVREDTILMSYATCAETGLHSLKQLAKDKLFWSDYAIDVRKIQNYTFEEIAQYNARDCIATLMLGDYFRERMDDRQLELYRDTLLPASDFVREIEWNGIALDVDYTRYLQETYQQKTEEFRDRLLHTAEVKEAVAKRGKSLEFNFGSSQQLAFLLYDIIGLKVPFFTEKGAPSTKEEALLALKGQHPIVEQILDMKFYPSMLAKFIHPLLDEWLDSDGRIRTSYWITGTVTGRLSATEPNLQQIPRHRDLRRMFCAQENRILIIIDYKQIDMWFMALFSGDKNLKNAFHNSLDLHTYVAQNALGQSCDNEKSRRIAKSINFGLINVVGIKKLAHEIGGTEREAKKFMDSYFQKFSGVKNFFKSQRKLLEEKGVIYNLVGRERMLPGIFSSTRSVREEAFRRSISTPVQSATNELTLKSGIRIYQYLKSINALDDVKLVGSIHDSLILEMALESMETDILDHIVHIMIHPDFFEYDMPLSVSVKGGINWGDAEEMEI